MRGRGRAAKARLLIFITRLGWGHLLILQEAGGEQGRDEIGTPDVLDAQRAPEDSPRANKDTEALFDLDAKMAEVKIERVVDRREALPGVRREELLGYRVRGIPQNEVPFRKPFDSPGQR